MKTEFIKVYYILDRMVILDLAKDPTGYVVRRTVDSGSPTMDYVGPSRLAAEDTFMYVDKSLMAVLKALGESK